MFGAINGVGAIPKETSNANMISFLDIVKVPILSSIKKRFSSLARKSGWKDDESGRLPRDWWEDIPSINTQAKERTGYPTQKPLDLLRRIITASSNDGDLVLDPFCGCATACIAAELEERQWVGIDISPKAAELVKLRMKKEVGLFYKGAHRTDIPQRTDMGKLPPPRSHAKTLYGAQAGNCAGCSVHFELRHLEVDHIIARKKGGTDHIENLQLLCGNCNRIKGDRGMEYLKLKLQMF